MIVSENKETEMKKEKDRKMEELQYKIRAVSLEAEKIKEETSRVKSKNESIENTLRVCVSLIHFASFILIL